MNEFVRKLTSRKFLLAVSAATALLASKQYVEAASVVAAYLGIEGVIDFRGAGSTSEDTSEAPSHSGTYA